VLIVQVRVNETVTVGDDVTIMVTGIDVGGKTLRGGHIKLGIQAPRHVRISREDRNGRKP
jgi:carbon storage regulator CsrA